MELHFNIICISFLLILLHLINISYAEKTVIRILVKHDFSDNFIYNDFESDYQSLMNNYFMEKNKDNPDLSDVELLFTFYEFSSANASDFEPYCEYDYPCYYDFITAYHRFEDNMIDYMRDNEYDMVIIDDRILYNDVSLIETQLIEWDFWILKPSLELFMDFSESIKNENKEYHDPKIFSDGTNKKNIFGLPYEIDFDLLYYHQNDEKAKSIVKDLPNKTWNDVLLSIKEEPSYSLEIPLGEDDNLLNFFIEYAYNHYNITKDYDSNFFNVFYNDTATSFFSTFYDFVMSYTNDEVDNSLYLYNQDAFVSFLEGNSVFFKGKASHHQLLCKNSEEISSSLPPKNISALTEKYLVVNQASNIDPKILTEVALQLTSKDMQLFRAEHFGTIPTFDLSKKENDPDIQSYCQSHSTLCNYIEKVNRLYIKDVFKSKYSQSYFEIEYLLPGKMREYLEYNDIDGIISVFYNIKNLVTHNLGVYGVLSYIFTFICAFIGFLTMFYVYKYKNHPYIKVVSPTFCNIAVFGCIMSIFKVIIHLPPYSILKARLFLIYNTINFSLIYIPMFFISYRIYRIYNSKMVISKSLTNKRLSIFIWVVILALIIYRTIIAFVDNMYYMCDGDITSSRFPMYEYVSYDFDHKIYEYFLYTIFVALIVFISSTGKNVRKFGNICYIFVIFILNIEDYTSEEIILFMGPEHYGAYFFLTNIYYCMMCLLCIFILVGCRVIFVLVNPNVKSTDANDLKDFIPLQLTKLGYNGINKRISRISSIVGNKVNTKKRLSQQSNPNATVMNESSNGARSNISQSNPTSSSVTATNSSVTATNLSTK